ncbi:hypothetical protein ABZP36_012908 [Zizania latifolia]
MEPKSPHRLDPSTFDNTALSCPLPPDRVWRLVEDISLTLAESTALSTLLLHSIEIPSAPPIAILNYAAGLGGGGVAAVGAAGEDCASAAAFDTAIKIKVIKEIRSFTDLGPKEARN